MQYNNNNSNNNNFNQSFSGCESTPNNFIKKEKLQSSFIHNINNYAGSNGSAFLNNLNQNLKQGVSQGIAHLHESHSENKLPGLLNFETTLKKFSKINLNNSKAQNDALQIDELETKIVENIVISEASNNNFNLNEMSIHMTNHDFKSNNIQSQISNIKLNSSVLKNLNFKDKNILSNLNTNYNTNNNINIKTENSSGTRLNNFSGKEHSNNHIISNNQSINPSNNFLTENNTNITTQSTSNALNSNTNNNLKDPNSSSFKSNKNLNSSIKSNPNYLTNNTNNSNSHNSNNNRNTQNPNSNIIKNEVNADSNSNSNSNALLSETNLQAQAIRKKSNLEVIEASSVNNNNFNLNTNANTHNTHSNTNSNLININSINNAANGTPQPIRNTSSYTNTNSTYNYDEVKNSETNKVKHIEELHIELVRMIQNYNLAVRVQEKENEEENNMHTVNKCDEKDIN